MVVMNRLFRIVVPVLLLIVVAAQAQESTPEATSPPDAEPARTIEDGDVTLWLYTEALPQGRAGLLRLESADEIESASVRFAGKTTPFFRAGDSLYALISADMDLSKRTHELVVTVRRTGTESSEISTFIEVIDGGFIRQDVLLVGDQSALVDAEIESAELTRIFELADPHTPESFWLEDGFVPPVNAELTSPFGAVRVFNGLYNTRHTGWDFQASIGMPMRASSAGRVVFAGPTPIRGNYVMIDHGRGIYSGYAHLSVIYVTQGQMLNGGQIVGLVGSTGRSSSAHAHVEYIINGHWVDGADFLQMPLPSAN